MGAVQVSDELQRVIERQVAKGRAASAAAFLEEAVRRLINDAQGEEEAIRGAAQAGTADAEAGRYATVTTPEHGQLLHERLMARLRESLTSNS